MKRVAAAVVLASACRPAPPPVDSCADPLGGVWIAPDQITPSGEPRRYHVADLGRAIEIYPMFDDSVLDPRDRKLTTADAVIVAPSAFDLTRSSDGKTMIGQQTRRFARGAATCVLHSPARIATCTGDRLDLEETPLAAPTDWDRCAPPPGPPMTLTLHRERD
jgi:hypothetical protein